MYMYLLSLGSFIQVIRKIFRKTNISYPIIHAPTSAYGGKEMLVFQKKLFTY